MASDSESRVQGGHEVPPLPAEIQVSTVEPLIVTSGDDLRTALRVANEGSREVTIKTNGAVYGHVVDPETRAVVGVFDHWLTAPLVQYRVPASGTVEIPLVVGTASPASSSSESVPPGEWAIQVVLELHDEGSFRAPLLPLKVTPN